MKVSKRANKAKNVWKVRCMSCKKVKAYSALSWDGNVCPACSPRQGDPGGKEE